MSKYINAELFVNGAKILKSEGLTKEDNRREDGVINVRQYDAKSNKSVPYIGEYLSVELLVTSAYEWEDGQRIKRKEGSMSGQKVYHNILLDGLDTGRRDKELKLVLSDSPDNSHELPGGVYISQISLDGVLSTREYNGKEYYDVFKLSAFGSEKEFKGGGASSIDKVSTKSRMLFSKLLGTNTDKKADAPIVTTIAATPAKVQLEDSPF